MSNQPSEDADLPLGIRRLRSIIQHAPARLTLISEEASGLKPSPTQWSKKEELGHLIDSAGNNHRRVILAQLEDAPALKVYDGDGWVASNGYAARKWSDVIDLWKALNTQLLAAAEAAPASAWARTCTIGGSEPLTLRFVIDDYVDHMMGHLKHIGLNSRDIEIEEDGKYPEKPAPADRPINPLFDRRWSPRLFAEDRQVEREAILTLLESARWAPSCFNEQPARYLVFDGSDPEALERARDCLVEGNSWARKAPVLMLSVARDNFTFNEQPNRHSEHDVGLASENLVLAAVDLGLAAHQMGGFEVDRSRSEFKIPDGFTPMAMIAIGYPYRGNLENLDEKTRTRELAPRSRNPIAEIAFAGRWEIPYGE